MKNCIICYKEFTKAPPEHVIPKSIGGQYTIHSVCKECNSHLNKKIDEVFKEHKIISSYRFIFGIKGRGKKPPYPFKNETIILGGKEHTLELTQDLKIQARLKPSFPKISDLKPNEPFEVTVDGKDMNLLDDYLNKVASKLEVPKENINITNKQIKHRDESQVLVTDSNNKIIMEFSKILYQTACDLLGDEYVNDILAKKYANMLRNGEIDMGLKNELNPNGVIVNQVFLHTIPNLQKMEHTHAIMITGYMGLGLVGFIKIFDSYHVQILSRDDKFVNTGMMMILNDFNNKTLGIHKPNKLPKCSINLYNDGVFDFTKVGIEFQNSPDGNQYPVFTKNYKKIANNLFDLANDFRFSRSVDSDFKSYMNVKLTFNNKLFIKSKSINKFLPLESVVYHYKIATIKSR